jgi:endonuclease/exonuclease/phosphatase (EEP) superfamily protein YafD
MWQRVVPKLPLMQPYIYGTHRTVPFGGEAAIFSKRPLKDVKRIWTALRMNYEIDIPVDGQTLRLFCLHAPRPMELPGQDYRGYWEKTLPIILSQPDPTIVLGDFNATQYSFVYQTLTSGSFRSAHEDRGRGYATTWPNGVFWAPPIRIDQALLSPSVECLRIVEGRGHGSDHKPLIVDVRLRPPADREDRKTPADASTAGS